MGADGDDGAICWNHHYIVVLERQKPRLCLCFPKLSDRLNFDSSFTRHRIQIFTFHDRQGNRLKALTKESLQKIFDKGWIGTIALWGSLAKEHNDSI